ncbi:ABC transporter ATP-binding protein [Xylocopilactobacillus apicola]|uniref:ABC transporter ATP-binding protein n=1 Tax=Xylocopilactobacillus apicola TaxID=2932184 RepID=A0AAU9D738_9LACO|nr:ABC transporter ATP-binding protein [Xylocopilactobacillus apicola]BDR58196.1 ABC transporter ATP-binding protein [Xylocopilactobacillus apicola]
MDNEEQNESVWAKHFTLKEQFHIVGRLNRYLMKYPWHLIFSIILGIVTSLVYIEMMTLIQTLLDEHLKKGETATKLLLGFTFSYLAFVIIRVITQYISSFVYYNAMERAKQDLRKTLYQKVMGLGMTFFDRVPAGSIVSRLVNDTESMNDFWYLFYAIISGIVSIITSLTTLYMKNSQLTLYLMCFIPVILIIARIYFYVSTKNYRQMRQRLSEINVKISESVEGINIIQQFRQERRIQKQFDQTNESYYNARKNVIKMNALLLAPIINLLNGLADILILSYFGVMSFHNPIEVGYVFLFVNLTSNFFNPFVNIMDVLSTFQDGIVSGSRIFRIMDSDVKNPEQHSKAELKITRGKVEFRHVNFSYNDHDPILKDLSFVVEPGQTLALVGHTGSGKSSIINVLMRFYEFGSGDVLIDDQDIRDYPIAEIRHKLGLVLQDSFIFYGDVKSNIRMFNTKISDQEVKQAAQIVHADRFIERLPQQYDEKVIEGGKQFSTGEKQLLAFARTMVTDPKILVLDEATANIDTQTEEQIQASLKAMQNGRTTIAIAHRLSTIVDADQILVLDSGQIIEAGTHETLIKRGGYYAKMFKLQHSAVD